MQAKFLLTAQRLNMTKTDLMKFTPPKAIYSYYQRRLVYDMNKSQIDIFENILIFPASAKTVKQRKESLIMFLENHPNYRDITYIHIWFNIAEDYLKIGKRIRVPNYTFQNARNVASTASSQMSFFGITQNNDADETDADETDTDDEINELSFLMSRLSIM